MSKLNIAAISTSEFSNHLNERKLMSPEEKEKSQLVGHPLRVSITKGTDQEITPVVVDILCLLNKADKVILIPINEVGTLTKSLLSGYHLESTGIPDFADRIRLLNIQSSILEFSELAQTPLLIPLNQNVSTLVIQLCYCEKTDPFTVISSLGPHLISTNVAAFTFLYYFSCLQYTIGFDPLDLITPSDLVTVVTAPESLIQPDERERICSVRNYQTIDMTMIYTHALFGAYACCHGVTTKTNMTEWMRKRHNALASSINMPTSPNITLQLDQSGAILNTLVNERPEVKSMIFNIVKARIPIVDEPRSLALRSQLEMLLSFTEMTVYGLITRLLIRGPGLFAYGNVPHELIRFLEEKATIETKLVSDGYQPEDISFIRLIYPGFPCFIASHYPDLIVGGLAVEVIHNPSSIDTINKYQVRTDGATLTRAQAIQLLKRTKGDVGGIAHLNEEQAKKFLEYTGQDFKMIQEEAVKTLKMVIRHRRALGEDDLLE